MRPHQPRSFATATAAKLDRLEVVAALLERDAVNGRALYAEMGATLARGASGTPPRSRRWRQRTAAGRAAVRGAASLAITMLRSRRLHAAVRATWDFLVDFAVVLAAGCIGVAILAAAFTLIAPPF